MFPLKSTLLSFLLTTSPAEGVNVKQLTDQSSGHMIGGMMDISLIQASHRRKVQAVDEIQTDASPCPGNPFLWKIIEDESGKHVGFGVGTLHFPSDLALTDDAYGSIIHAVEDSCGIYGELDLMDGIVAQELAGCVGDLNVEAAKIADIQDEDLRLSYENVSREFAVLAAGAGADAESIDIIHQQLLQLSLYSILSFITFSNTPEYEEYFLQKLFGMPPSSLDQTLLSLGRPNGGVEEVSTQCEILAALILPPEELNEAELRLALNQTFSGILNMYKCGDIDTFTIAQEMNFEQSMAGSEFMISLLDTRNEQMAAGIDEILKVSDDRVLFAFGASHWTVGEKSLDVLLKGYGYSLEYVPNYAKDDAEDLSNEECEVVFNSIDGVFDLIGVSNSTASTPVVSGDSESPSASPVSSPSKSTASPISSSDNTASPVSGGSSLNVFKASIAPVLCAFGSMYLY
eukprot:scaffold6578_cov141-Skeletonema_marinoi.AAC.8